MILTGIRNQSMIEQPVLLNRRDGLMRVGKIPLLVNKSDAWAVCSYDGKYLDECDVISKALDRIGDGYCLLCDTSNADYLDEIQVSGVSRRGKVVSDYAGDMKLAEVCNKLAEERLRYVAQIEGVSFEEAVVLDAKRRACEQKMLFSTRISETCQKAYQYYVANCRNYILGDCKTETTSVIQVPCVPTRPGSRNDRTVLDIDFFLNKKKRWLFVDLKYVGKTGYKVSAPTVLPYMKIVDGLNRMSAPAIYIIAYHNVEAPGVVDVGNCIVASAYHNKRFSKLDKIITVDDILNDFI